MKVYNGFMLVVATIVFIALGACLIFVGADIFTLDRIIDFFQQQNSFWVSIVGVVFLLLGIVEILLGMKKLGRVPAVAFSNPLGEVRIAYDALEGYVKSLSSEIPEIKDAKPRVVAGRGGIEIHARLVVERDVNLPETTSRFQDLISRYVKDVMGIEDIAAIRVYIQKISSKKSQLPQEETE
jgi:uncharacterized alkaline shock family protein YloU